MKIRALPIAVSHVFFKMSMTGVARVIADYWRRLGGQADIYMKYSGVDTRVQESDKGETALVVKTKQAADHDRYRKQGILVYPLYRIQRDIAAGSTPEARFLAMCSA